MNTLIYSDSFFHPPGILNPKHELTVLEILALLVQERAEKAPCRKDHTGNIEVVS